MEVTFLPPTPVRSITFLKTGLSESEFASLEINLYEIIEIKTGC